MRFLHIADLHLGKRMYDMSLQEDQMAVLAALEAMAVREAVDAVLIAGDVYQKASPPGEAMEAFNCFVTHLAERGIRVCMISGNHDSPRQIAYFSALIRANGVYASESFTGTLQKVTLADDLGEVDLYLLPFVKPGQVRRAFPEENICTYQEAVEAVLRHSPVDTARRNVLLAHQFITGAQVFDSEEVTVGGLDQVDAAIFRDFDYVALGHLHGPQKVGRETLRYAGSPLQYSFSEAHHSKSAVLVEMGEKGDVRVRLLPIPALHAVREVRGFLEEILALPYSEDYVRVTVTDELVPPDARVTVLTVFPNMMKFAVENSHTRTELNILARENVEDKTLPELFGDFYRLQNNGAAPTPGHMALLEEILKNLEEEENEAR